MAKEKKNAEAVAETQAAPAIELVGNVNVPLEIREEIVKKAEALKAEHKLRKVFVIIVEGEEGDDKPLYRLYAPPRSHALQPVYELRSEGCRTGQQDARNQHLPCRRPRNG